MGIVALPFLLASWLVADHFPPWLSFHAEAPAFLSITFAAWAYIYRSTGSLTIPAAILWILTLIVSAAVQWSLGIIPYLGDVLLVALYLLTFAASWFLGYHWTENSQSKVIESMSWLLLLAGLIVALQVLAHWLSVEGAMGGWVIDGLINGRPRANIGQPNHAATLLLMATVSAAILREYTRLRAYVMWGVVALLSFCVVLTQSRTALLSVALLSLLFVLFTPKRLHLSLSKQEVLVWSSFVYAMVFVVPYIDILSNPSFSDVRQMTSAGARKTIWLQLSSAVFDKPWMGWGWQQVASAQQVGAQSHAGFEQVNYAHNVFLDLVLAVGIPCSTAFLGVALWWFKSRFHIILNSGPAIMAGVILLPFAVHCMLEMPHVYMYFLALAGILMGVIDKCSTPTEYVVWRVKRGVLYAILATQSVLLSALGVEYLKAEEDFRVNRFENRMIGVTPSEYEVPTLYLLDQLRELLRAMRLRAQPEMSPDDIDLMLRVAKRYSWAPIQLRSALALGLNGRTQEATQRLLVIKNMFDESTYQDAKFNINRLMIEKYPQLNQVVIP